MSWELRYNLGIPTNLAPGNFNNLTSTTASIADSIDFLTGNPTGIGISYTASPDNVFQNAGFSGVGVADLSWCSTPAALADAHYISVAGNWAALTLTGLTVGATYIVKCASSTTATGRVTSWRVNGGTSQDLASYDATNSQPNNSVGLTFTFTATATTAVIEYTRAASSSGNSYANALLVTNASSTVSADATVASGATLNYSTVGLGTITSAVLSDGTNTLTLTSVTDTTALVPALANNLQYCLFGTVTLTVSDGTNSASTMLTLNPPAGYSKVSLLTGFVTDVNSFLYNYGGTPQVGDQFVWNSTALILNSDGTFTATADGSYPVYGISSADGLMQSFNIIVGTFSTTVSSVGGPANGTYHQGDNLDFDVTFDYAVAISTTGGVPFVAIQLSGAVVQASYLSQPSSTVLRFRYIVQLGDTAPTGITIGSAIQANGGSITNQNGTGGVDLTLNNVPSFSAVIIEGSTTGPLGAGGVLQTAPVKLSLIKGQVVLYALINTDQDSAVNGAVIEGSDDLVTWYPITVGSVTGGIPLLLQAKPIFEYQRLKLTNGSVAQTTLSTRLSFTY
jgi:hypothetical protein